jgi:Ca-activated chloride channel family protein
MQRRLVSRPSQTRRLLRCGLLTGAALLLIVALMRPQWGLYYEHTPRAGTELMVCLDVSRSMLAEDVSPNRLERAKAEIADLLTYLDGDHVGLIAFAGKATVLCPLTPDFGFLRLVLDAAGPHCVARGGTDLAAPIQQAVAGFGGAGDVSRAILLITDGEDLGSFPVEAAKKAAERGIKIFTIGLGSEEGSQIMFTDRRTGSRTVVTGADGQPVISRLGGETLREMALATEGAYVPAGTGVLDLESIYRDLLAPLTRGQLDSRGRPMRKEGFQWAVLLALIALLGAVGVTSGRPAAPAAAPVAASRGALSTALVLILLGFVPAARAQQASTPPTPVPPAATPAAPAAPGNAASGGGAADAGTSDTAPPEDPRMAYNRGLRLLESGELDEAEKNFLAARQKSGADGPARYRATYNLGWVYVKRHDGVLDADPEQGLRHLHSAAAWFREAVRLRPEETDARHNLEVIMRKALALADALRKKDDDDVAKRLDALIETQRGFLGEARALTTRSPQSADPAAEDSFRADFRALATQQRQIQSDAARLADDAAVQREAIEAKAEDQRTPEDKVRSAQLGGALHYLHESNERLGQARRLLKQQSGERGCRRAAAGLSKLRRARDQLRDPVAVLGAIVEDLRSIMDFTLTHAAGSGLAGIDAGAGEDPGREKPPPWLTLEYLQEEQAELAQRGQELHTHLSAGLQGIDDGSAPPPPAESQRFIEQLRVALPFISAGQDALNAAAEQLVASAVQEAIAEQRQALQNLLEAREQFLDLRGLIELVYASQRQLQALVKSSDPQVRSALDEYLPLFSAIEQKDLLRAQRLRTLVDEELQQIPAEDSQAPPDAPSGPGPQAEDAEQHKAQRQRLELAVKFLDAATYEMNSARSAFETAAPQNPEGQADSAPGEDAEAARPAPEQSAAGPPPQAAPETPDRPAGAGSAPAAAGDKAAHSVAQAAPAVDRSVTFIADLRRLFLSIIEHLQDTAQRQQEILAQTAEAAAEAEESARALALGPLTPRQRELAAVSGEIAKVLEEQSKQPPQAPAGQPADKQQQEQAQEMQDRLARASELVHAAQGEMDQAAGGLQDAPPELDGVQQHQGTAFEHLVAALQVLQPPQDKQQQQQDSQDQQQQQQQGQQQQEQQQEQEQATQADLARLLQGVRDREARHRAERDQQATQRYEAVEKDW